MNERIKLLADEAAKFSATMALPTGESGDNLFVEKFAELILKECFQYLENEEDILWNLSEKEEDRIFRPNYEICAEKCRDIRQGLKEHFGIKK